MNTLLLVLPSALVLGGGVVEALHESLSSSLLLLVVLLSVSLQYVLFSIVLSERDRLI